MPEGSAVLPQMREHAEKILSTVKAWFQRVRWPKVGVWAGGILAGFIGLIVLILLLADWNALRGPIGKFASGIAKRDIVIAGDLEVHPWSFSPTIRIKDLRIGNPFWAQKRGVDWTKHGNQFATIPYATTQIELWPLLWGDVRLRNLELHEPDIRLARDKDGLSNWAKDPSDRTQAKPLKLPMIRRFVVTDGALNFDDKKRAMLLEASLNSHETLGHKNGAFQLTGEGSLNRQPFNLSLTGAALINVKRNEPYAFKFDMKSGPTRIAADGSLRRPFNFAQFSANVKASGDDLSDLYTIIGLTLPNTPPYSLKTKLSRTERGYTLADIGGRVGDSDLSGRLDVVTYTGRPRVEANMVSNSLDFDDLATVLGAPPSIKTGEAASPEQRAEAARLAAQGRILPDARLDLERVRNMDAHLIFDAKKIKDAPLPLRSATLDLTLDRGLLKMEPVNFALPRGTVNAVVQIDARQDEPQIALDARMSKARIEDFFKTKNVLEGGFMGRVKLQGHGATVRKAAATSNGTVTFVLPHGEVREAFAELTGVNVTRGLGLLLSGDKSQAELRCGVASFDVAKGVAKPRVLVFDTEDVLITGKGNVDLGEEKYDLKLQGHPKELRLVRLDAPITIGGRWRTPKLGVDADDVVKQGGIAGLASLLNPLAALLPFVDPGLADDANCKALLSRYPVNRASNAPPAKG